MGRPKPSRSRKVRGQNAKAQSLASVIQETFRLWRKRENTTSGMTRRSTSSKRPADGSALNRRERVRERCNGWTAPKLSG